MVFSLASGTQAALSDSSEQRHLQPPSITKQTLLSIFLPIAWMLQGSLPWDAVRLRAAAAPLSLQARLGRGPRLEVFLGADKDWGWLGAAGQLGGSRAVRRPLSGQCLFLRIPHEGCWYYVHRGNRCCSRGLLHPRPLPGRVAVLHFNSPRCVSSPAYC